MPDSDRAGKPVPRPTLRRLPAYLRLLRELAATGTRQVSCTVLAEVLGQDPTQVRKDLGYTEIVGRPKIGYEVPDLVAAIERFLGWDNASEAFLAGAGDLGRALLGYEGFRTHGLNIIAAFEADAAKIGVQVHGRAVLPIAKLGELARRMHIRIGVIAVPADTAQAVAETMVAGGITAIWNFAPMRLQLDEGVIVENEDLSASFAVLSRRLARATRQSKRRS